MTAHPVVTRRVRRGMAVAHAALEPVAGPVTIDLGHAGRLALGCFHVSTRTELAPWRASGSLRSVGRHWARSTRIEIEIAPHSSVACELRLVPATRSPERWGPRRSRHYFDAAHAAADRLVAMIVTAAVEPEAGQPDQDAA